MDKIKKLEKLAQSIRKDIVEMTYHAGAAGSHIGGALSCSDVLAVLYGEILNCTKENAMAAERDRFILSKGHSSIALYAALHQSGFLTDNEITTFEANGGFLPAHSVMNIEKGIELSSGSLGLGLSFGIGEAVSAKKKHLGYKVFVLMGNGECNEGSVWEAVTLASHLHLDNLYMIIDDNKQQLDGMSEHVLSLDNLSNVLEMLGFESYKVNGHCTEDLLQVFEKSGKQNKPVAIVMETVKGKGISFMENNPEWHHNKLSRERYESSMKEIEKND